MRNACEQNGVTICSICNVEAKYVACEARLYIEKNLKKKTNTVKHYGSHTCLLRKKRRPDRKEIEDLINVVTGVTRETIIKLGVKRKLEEGGVQTAVNAARRFTDTKFIDNLVTKKKKMLRPHGHNFAAVKALKEAWDSEDMFFIYAMDEGDQDGCLCC